MKNVHKKIIAIILVLVSFMYAGIYKEEANASSSSKYLVLVQQKNGSWKGYRDIIEMSENGYLMIKAKRISKALGYTYVKNDNGSFEIKDSDVIYNTYTKGSNEFIYSNGIEEVVKMSPEKAYTSKESKYNLCQISSLGTLVYYKTFNNPGIEEYSDYQGIICFSKYEEIPEALPVIELKPTKVPTISSELEEAIEVEGIEFPLRSDFLEKGKALSDWGGRATVWRDLEAEVEGKLITSTNLVFDSDKIEFTHLGLGSDGISLTKSSKGYKLAISVKLKGSVVADQNASIVKAMVATISSKPSLVYDAIYNSFTTNETYGINEDSYVDIGDCQLKVEMKDGIVTYYIKGNN
ncbi:MAG TPA: hypothetical protein GXZ21_02360 [Clostridiales bacterium]|nr:hypothetical protein [Clostridiales bacterium]